MAVVLMLRVLMAVTLMTIKVMILVVGNKRKSQMSH